MPTPDAVTLYDIGTRKIWATMTHREAEADIQCAIELGDTVQEYDTTDRAGNPLRVALNICTRNTREDLGGVYEFTR